MTVLIPSPACTAVWSEGVAGETFDLLQGAVNENYGHVKFLRPTLWQRLSGQNMALGAKSGTTDDIRDTWCAGVTPQYAMSVWIGDPQGVGSVPTEMYREQTACREIGLLRQLPHELRELPLPGDLTRRDGAAVPLPGVHLHNPGVS